MSQNILIIKFSSLGDIVHVVPALNALKKHLPEARFTFAVNREFAPLVQCIPVVDEIAIFDRKRWGSVLRFPVSVMEIFNFAKNLRINKFEFAVDFMGLLRSGLTAYFSGARERVGFSDAREFSTIFYNRSVKTAALHAVTRNLEVARFLGADISNPEFNLQVPDLARKNIQEILSKLKPPVIAISPSARWASKQWGDENFVELAHRLKKEHAASIVFFGAPSEAVQVAKVRELSKIDALDLSGKTTLPELAALMDEVDLLVCNDSGPMHLRAAFGKPLVAIFGPTDPRKVGPYKMQDDVVSAPSDCAPCRRRDCNTPLCQRGVSVDAVFKKAASKL